MTCKLLGFIWLSKKKFLTKGVALASMKAARQTTGKISSLSGLFS